MRLSLPYPPSMNHYWRSVRGRNILSRDGREYRARVQMMGHECMSCRVQVVAVAYMPDRRRRDLDNLWKCLLDSLMHAAVLEDDSQCDRLEIVRGPVVPGGRVDLEISEWTGLEQWLKERQ